MVVQAGTTSAGSVTNQAGSCQDEEDMRDEGVSRHVHESDNNNNGTTSLML